MIQLNAKFTLYCSLSWIIYIIKHTVYVILMYAWVNESVTIIIQKINKQPLFNDHEDLF